MTVFGFLMSILALQANGQNRIDTLRNTLDSLSAEFPGLEEKVEFSVSGATIHEFLRGIAENHDLNISVDQNLDIRVSNNFNNAVVKDVLIFLSEKYRLDADVYGSILAFRQLPEKEKKPVIREPDVNFNNLNSFLSLDLKNDTLAKVIRKITDQSGLNVLADPAVKDRRVNAFIKNRPFENAIMMMAESNDLKVEKKADNYFFITEKGQEENDRSQRTAQRNTDERGGREEIELVKGLDIELEDDRLTVVANEVELKTILDRVSHKCEARYFLYTEPKGKISTYIDNVTYEDFVEYLLHGTEYTFKFTDGVYLIGKRDHEILRTTELVRLQNRTIESILDFVPQELKKGVDIKEFTELNGLILSGSRPNIRELKTFLASVDQVVPVVKIEVMIVDVTRNSTLQGGVDLRLGGDVVQQTSGKLSPGIDMDLSSSTINQLINSFNGFGFVNLGKVTPNFYASIQALEANGVLKMRSTPMLATLNGHEADLKIGNTEYYLEVQNDLVGTQNPVQQQSQTYKAVNADLSLNIKPIVSSDDNVTLEIEVQQSDFTARISETAPPGKVTRNFKSYIRVRNGEMIMLGGLEEKSVERSGSGLPFLSKIPVLKWIFGKQSKNNNKTRLNIFIRPRVIY